MNFKPSRCPPRPWIVPEADARIFAARRKRRGRRNENLGKGIKAVGSTHLQGGAPWQLEGGAPSCQIEV